MLNLEARKTLCTALIQCHFDYSCSSWHPGIGKTLEKKLQVMQNKIVRFILKLDGRSHIGDTEIIKAGFLNISDRVSQLRLGHVFKISNKTSPYYLHTHFQKINESRRGVVTRAMTNNNFYMPKISTNTFAYTSIKDWNNLPSNIKGIKSEKTFKNRVKMHLKAVAIEKDK